jgi:hypothetical protein
LSIVKALRQPNGKESQGKENAEEGLKGQKEIRSDRGQFRDSATKLGFCQRSFHPMPEQRQRYRALVDLRLSTPSTKRQGSRKPHCSVLNLVFGGIDQLLAGNPEWH